MSIITVKVDSLDACFVLFVLGSLSLSDTIGHSNFQPSMLSFDASKAFTMSAHPALSRPTSLIAGQTVVSLPSSRSVPSNPPTSTAGEEFWAGGSCVYSFGAGDFGQLALGFAESSKVPCMVEGTAAFQSENGTVVVGPPIVSVSAGGYHTLMLDSEGTVYACGDNSNGQLGIGAYQINATRPGIVRRRSECHPSAITKDAEGNPLPAMRWISAGTVR